MSRPHVDPRRRRLALALLYLSEGAPIGYLWWALPTKLRAAGVPVEEVAALSSLLTLPWAFKFLWAPLVDVFRSPRHGVKPWIVVMQLAMAASIAPMAFLDLQVDYDLIVVILMAHALFASTQDAAIDALAVRSIPSSERALATGWMQAGMLAGRAVFGGAALTMESIIGVGGVVALLASTILLTSAVVLTLDDRVPATGETAVAAIRRVAARLRAVFGSATTWLGIVFVVFAGAAMEGAGALAGPLMIDSGLSQVAVGRFFALPAVAAMAIGALAGGRWVDARERSSAVVGALVSVAVSVLTAAAVVSAQWPAMILVALTCVYLTFGVLTAALYALMMDLTDPALGGTQFSTYMAAVNLCYVWSAWAAGQLAGAYGYAPALAAMVAVSFLSLPVLRALRGASASS